MTKKEVPPQTSKQHIRDILLLFSIPIGIIAVLIAFLYVPRLFAHPAYDFIYCEGYKCDDRFSVDPNGNLQVAPEDDRRYSYSYDADLFYYDVQRDATRPLQADEATRYRLDATSKSPDGYTLKYSSGGGGLLFWGGGQRSWSLNKGLASKPLEIDVRYGDNTFIGWVLP